MERKLIAMHKYHGPATQDISGYVPVRELVNRNRKGDDAPIDGQIGMDV